MMRPLPHLCTVLLMSSFRVGVANAMPNQNTESS